MCLRLRPRYCAMQKKKRQAKTALNIVPILSSRFFLPCKSFGLIAIKMEIEEIQFVRGLDCGYYYIASHFVFQPQFKCGNIAFGTLVLLGRYLFYALLEQFRFLHWHDTCPARMLCSWNVLSRFRNWESKLYGFSSKIVAPPIFTFSPIRPVEIHLVQLFCTNYIK